jgi:phenylacetate-CoA ligase
MTRPTSQTIFNSFARNVALPMNDVIAGTDISRQLRFLETSQWWERSDLQEYQDMRLRRIINHAFENVPYYRELFRSLNLRPSDIRSTDDLEKLPVLTKSDIRQCPEKFIAQNIEKSSLIHDTTSGSSGHVFNFYLDKNTLSIMRAVGMRSWGFAGYRVGDKIVTLAGSALLAKNLSAYNRIRFRFSRNLPLSSYHMDTNQLNEYLKQVVKFKPKYIRGYPSSIAILADFAHQSGANSIIPQGIMTTAETLTKNQRNIISLAFNCDVFDQFGCNDGGANACECSHHKGYHIAMERSVHEFLDDSGKPVKTGENGHIVLTDLWNYAMPLIRYDAGDMGVPSDKSCSCGRGLPLIEKLSGRTIEQIKLPDGQQIPGLLITDVFEHGEISRLVLDYQVVQEHVNKIVISIVTTGNISTGLENEIIEHVRGHLGSTIDIKIKYTDEIPRTEANKRKIVISKMTR